MSFRDLVNQLGYNPYYSLFKPTHTCKEALTAQDEVSVGGRLVFKRNMGKASFINIQDKEGSIQVYLNEQGLPEGQYTILMNLCSLGDVLGVTGTIFTTKTGELSIKASNVLIVAKNNQPWPDKYHGIKTTETKYRQRYLDLLTSEQSRSVFAARSIITSTIRKHLEANKFQEVETPILHGSASGAAAEPFVTYHEALNLKLYLRIAPELYLKRLIVAGMERVYEINRNFRNEGLSTRHNPEFTMLECYQSYADYQDMMLLTKDLLCAACISIHNSTEFTYKDMRYDMSKIESRRLVDVISSMAGLNPNNLDDLLGFCKSNDIDIPIAQDRSNLYRLQTLVFEHFEPTLLHPIFITDYPSIDSPLARVRQDDPNYCERFELYIGGMEIANAYSELSDPELQASNLLLQGKHEAEYIDCLSYGMVPTGGLGIGIDRLVMLLTNSTSIREVVLFPTMKPIIN